MRLVKLSIAFMSAVFVHEHVCSVRVTACERVCVLTSAYAHVLIFVCCMSACFCMFIQDVCLFFFLFCDKPSDSDPFLLKSVALTLCVSRLDKWKHARARRRRKKKYHTP